MPVHVSEDAARAAVPSPSLLRHYVDYCNGQTNASTAFHVATGLALLATLVPPDFGFAWGSHTVRPNLYVLLVGDAGFSRRTTSLMMLHHVSAEAVPPERLQAASPETWKKMMRTIQATSPQLTILESNLGRFFHTRRGEKHLAPLCEWYIDAYTGPSMGFTTEDYTVSVPWVAPTLVGGASTHEIKRAMRDDFRVGLWARFLTVRGEPREWMERPDPKGPAKLHYLGRMARYYAKHAAAALAGVSVTPEAQAYSDNRGRDLHGTARAFAEDDLTRSVIAWASDLALRIAMLLAFDDALFKRWSASNGDTPGAADSEDPSAHSPEPVVISLEIIQRAWGIVDFHIAGADSLVRSEFGPVQLK